MRLVVQGEWNLYEYYLKAEKSRISTSTLFLIGTIHFLPLSTNLPRTKEWTKILRNLLYQEVYSSKRNSLKIPT